MIAKPRRRKIVGIPDWVLERLLQLPEGASIDAIFYSMQHGALEIVISHPSCPDVTPGEMLPRLYPSGYKTDDGGLRLDWEFDASERATEAVHPFETQPRVEGVGQ